MFFKLILSAHLQNQEKWLTSIIRDVNWDDQTSITDGAIFVNCLVVETLSEQTAFPIFNQAAHESSSWTQDELLPSGRRLEATSSIILFNIICRHLVKKERLLLWRLDHDWVSVLYIKYIYKHLLSLVFPGFLNIELNHIRILRTMFSHSG